MASALLVSIGSFSDRAIGPARIDRSRRRLATKVRGQGTFDGLAGLRIASSRDAQGGVTSYAQEMLLLLDLSRLTSR